MVNLSASQPLIIFRNYDKDPYFFSPDKIVAIIFLNHRICWCDSAYVCAKFLADRREDFVECTDR